ncbi:MAG TPA: PQQ-dependent sugar dehydrogenase [Bacteroidales bacterium]|nr:PQQ-dependent sugar dehydrogenase [Bacteroidales bacterium]
MKTILILFVVLAMGSCSGQKTSNQPLNPVATHTIKPEILAEGLENPWSMAFLPDGRILIAERPGRLRVFQNGKLLPDPIQGLPPVWAHGQGGLLDVVLHPSYAQNGWIYLAYSTNEGNFGNTAIARARLSGNQLVDLEELFRGSPLTALQYHFGSRIVFEGDDIFYFPIGDRGEMENAQRLDNHNGKVMRLHADGSIPADNPFIGMEGAKPEIWTYGHRNIQGMQMHPVTGKLWTHEHGPRGGDEINIEEKGVNYGWPRATFGINYNGTIISNDTSLPGMVDPIHYWVPSIAPCGMTFVTSDLYPNWKNNLLVGALAGMHIQRLVFDGNKAIHHEKILEGFARFRDIRQGPDGYLYALTEGPGLFFRLKPE